MLRIYTFSATLLLLAVVLCSFRNELKTGREIYKSNCARCHGDDGSKGAFKAKNLRTSPMGESPMRQIIMEGKRPMPAFKDKLSPVQISLVLAYTRSLKQP